MSELLVSAMPTEPEVRRKKRKDPPDPRVEAVCSAIEDARVAQGYTDIRDVLKQATVAPSTWHAWKSGETEPDFTRLDDVAKVVGLRVGIVLDGPAVELLLRGGHHMPSELAQAIALLVDRLETDKQKLDLLSEVRKFVQTRVSGSRPPRGGGA